MDGPQHYDRYVAPFLAPYTAATIGAVPTAAIRVLDHGAGTGAVTLALLSQRTDRSVTALDPSAPMLARIPDKLDSSAEKRLTRIIGTVADLGSEVRFDAITSQIALAFCADIPVELATLRDHAEPGGVIVIASLGPPETVGAFTNYWEAARRVDPDLAPARDYPHFRTADRRALENSMSAAGWNVDGVDAIKSWRRVTPVDLWTWVSRALPLRTTDGTVLGPVSEETRNEIRTELQGRLADQVDPDGYLTLPMHGWRMRAHN